VYARLTLDDKGNILGTSGTITDIGDRKLMEQFLENKDRLLHGIAEASNILLYNSDYTKALSLVLQKLGEVTCVDRVYIFENHEHPETGEFSTSQRVEWSKENIMPQIDNPDLQNVSYEGLGIMRWLHTLSKDGVISGLIKDFPQTEREILGPQGIISIIAVPIKIDDKFWGFVGFDDCTTERKWSSVEISALSVAAAGIGAAIKRKQVEAALHEALQSDLKKSDEQIRYLEYYDSLTGLPNRVLFKDRLELAISHAKRNQEMFAVMFIDLDRFKNINDTLGHTVGDLLIKAVASRLKQVIQKDDTISRMGGDEFTLIFVDVKDEKYLVKIAEKIMKVFSEPLIINDHELFITASVGISVYPNDGEDAEILIKNADMAMYRAKEHGKNNYQFFTNGMNEKALKKLEIEKNLRKALEKNEFLLHYQPQIDFVKNRIVACEALIRWNNGTNGLVPPGDFIPLAEETGLIIPIGEWVLKTACLQLKKWHNEGHNELRMAVNISAQQFEQKDLAEIVEKILLETQVDPRYLELELTESAIMKSIERAAEIMQRLKSKGIRISIDDFGTGFSSLGYLQKFSADILKIDRSFIKNIPDCANDEAIVTAIINMAHLLGLSVIAEGVEREEQLNFLKSRSCDAIQGYLISKPVPHSEFKQLISGL
jgi:diguanylate cyclase (GGDEF)-like protein